MGEKETWDEAANLNSSKSNRVAGEEGGIAVGDEGVRAAGPRGGGEPAEATNLNSSRSNRMMPGGGTSEPPEAAVNTSHSNIKNQVAGEPGGDLDGDGEADPAEAAINNSHSNIKNLRTAEGGDGPADSEDAEAIRLNSSKSNAYREAAVDPADDGPERAEGTIVKSKSNITNN